jgi:diguanylate cyclase (GGDEF)-like protein
MESGMEMLVVNKVSENKDKPLFESSVIQAFEYDEKQVDCVLSIGESATIMRRMLQTIELSDLASSYFDLLRQKLPCTSIKISFAGQNILYGSSTPNARSMKISLSYGSPLCAPQHAQLTYVFSKVLSPIERKLLSEMHAIYALGLKHALEYYRIRQMASKDMLTGLYNRSHFSDSLNKLISMSLRNEHSFGLLVLDLDNFKQVNDKHGHQQGDEVLIEFGNLLSSCLRDSDHAFRFGGDEFCCLLIDSDYEANEQVAKRIQAAAAQHPLLTKHRVSTSVGATTFNENDTQHTLFKRADTALYQAKEGGKNLFKAA